MKTPKKPSLLKKLKQSSSQKNDSTPLKAPPRVTNNTVTDYRDEILSKAKKFKYPFYRSKHKIALVSIAVVVTASIVLGGGMLFNLYRRQSTSDFTRSVTRIFPFPVAKVNGSFVSYESYLFELGTAIHWQEEYGTTDLKSPDGKRQIEHFKRLALDRAMANTITKKLAEENNISVKKPEVDEVVNRIKKTGGGGDLNQILGEQLGSSESDIRRSIEQNILRKKVAHILDKEAPKRAEKAVGALKKGTPFADVAKQYSEDLATKQSGGNVGEVIKDKASLPKEVTDVLFGLKEGNISGVISTSSDYFIVRANKVASKNSINASVIRITVKSMDDYLAEAKKNNKVTEYIKITDDAPETLNLTAPQNSQK